MRSPNYTMRPQPFTVTQLPYQHQTATRSLYEPQTGYPPYSTFPSPSFFPYNQTQYTTPSSKAYFLSTNFLSTNSPYASSNSLSTTVSPYPSSNAPYLSSNALYPSSNPYPSPNPSYPSSNPPYPSSNPSYPSSNPTYPSSNPPYPSSNPSYPSSNTAFPSTSTEQPYTYILPDSQNPDFMDTTDVSNYILSQSNTDFSDATTPEILANETSFKVDENLVNQLETNSHRLPHIHSVDVQCSKDRMAINVEFSDVYNGIIYSKVITKRKF